MSVTNGIDKTAVPSEITTSSRVDAGIGTLEFTDGYPTGETAARLRDHLDYLHGVEAFMNSIQGVSTYALREGFLGAGIADGDVAIYSGLLDSRTLLLTGNADTVYFIAFLDLSDGPLVMDTPSDSLGIVDDMWFGWITDFGLPGPDRGQGGSYLLLPPGYDGPMPEGGSFVRHSSTNHVLVLGRAFIDQNERNDPAPTVTRIKEQLKIYPYVPGGVGSSIGSYLTGRGRLGQPATPQSPRFVEGTGLAMNTIPPNDFGHYELLDALVQMEPAEALDTELAGQFAAIGIVKGEKFAPDPRLRAILDEAVAVGNAASRTLGLGAHPADNFRLYGDDSAWWNMLFIGGFEFTNPPPMITAEGIQPFPNKGARQLHSRTGVFLHSDRYHPRHVHATGERRLPVPPRQRRPGRRTVQRRQDLPTETARRHPGRPILVADPLRQPDPIHAADPAAATHGPAARCTLPRQPRRRRTGPPSSTSHRPGPTDVAAGNWIQTDPDKGWFVALRLYSPLQSFFDKTWRPGEFELVR